VPTTKGDNYNTARQNYIKYDENNHASLTKRIHITQNQHTKTKTRLSCLLRHLAWNIERDNTGRMKRDGKAKNR